jgi:hypothetical protein
MPLTVACDERWRIMPNILEKLPFKNIKDGLLD